MILNDFLQGSLHPQKNLNRKILMSFVHIVYNALQMNMQKEYKKKKNESNPHYENIPSKRYDCWRLVEGI